MFLWPRHPSAPGPHGSKLQQNHSKWQTKGAGIRAQMSSMGPGQINREGRQHGHGAEDQHLLDATTEMSLQPNLSARPQPELMLIPRVCGLSPSLTQWPTPPSPPRPPGWTLHIVPTLASAFSVTKTCHFCPSQALHIHPFFFLLYSISGPARSIKKLTQVTYIILIF